MARKDGEDVTGEELAVVGETVGVAAVGCKVGTDNNDGAGDGGLGAVGCNVAAADGGGDDGGGGGGNCCGGGGGGGGRRASRSGSSRRRRPW